MYNKLSNMVEDQLDAQESGKTTSWSFSKISGHKKVTNKDPDYKGSMYNLKYRVSILKLTECTECTGLLVIGCSGGLRGSQQSY
jgi:hypothetical protein